MNTQFGASSEYLSVFVIVLVHEFGHALACRQVGGGANRIVLWPLGGIAFVNPPRRAGAYLWSIAAGPLVNVILLPVLGFFAMIAQASVPGSDVAVFFRDLNFLNAVLLAFNLLPVFPLDGGQIMRGLLWFPFGEIRSLQNRECDRPCRRSHSWNRGANGRINLVGNTGIFSFEPCLVWVAASKSYDRCLENGNTDRAFAHRTGESGAMKCHPEG